MSTQQQSGQNEVSQEEEVEQITLSELKDSIHLSANKLLELTYTEGTSVLMPEKYIATITKFNEQAIEHIDRDQQQQALVYLAEAQRTLEYGASCGKSIDRNLIISILNNEACCYYREGELAKCASYLEGVIYNLKAFGTSMEASPAGSSLLEKNKLKNIDEFYHVSLEKKIQLVHYSLRYCTINSQLGKRELALKAGHNVVRLVKSLFYDLLFENPKIHPCDSTKQDQELKELKELIKTQVFLKEQIKCDELEIYRKLGRIYVKKWNQKKINNRINREFEKHIRDYSISEVIDILPQHYLPNSDAVYESIANTRVIIRQLLHLAMGYFTISTEHRLLAQHRYPTSIEAKQSSDEWKSANIYHLLGIIFLGTNLNSDLLFMKQLISSYEQHYKFELLLEEHLPDEEVESFSQKLLFQPKRQKHSKQSSILFEKISKLKEKQDIKNNKTKEKNLNTSKTKDSEYKTLNSTKLNISKDITPQTTRKRSISRQQTSMLSSKKASQKNSMNNSTVNRTKILNETAQGDKVSTRKRSYSKDSVQGSKKITTNGMSKNEQATKTANEYQLQTPHKKPLQGQRKRRVSSVSSTKEVVLTSNRESSKTAKLVPSRQKEKRFHFDSERLRSPAVKMSEKVVKTKTEKGKQKETKQKRKVEKEGKKVNCSSKKTYYF